MDYKNYADIIGASAKGGQDALSAGLTAAGTKANARDIKRQSFADFINGILRNKFALNRVNTEYQDEMTDTRSNAIQQMARGFAEALNMGGRR